MTGKKRRGKNRGMKIRIKTFASVRDACGFGEKELAVAGKTSVGEVVQGLERECPGLGRMAGRLLFAVNQEYSGADKVLAEGDVLAIFPPVSGG